MSITRRLFVSLLGSLPFLRGPKPLAVTMYDGEVYRPKAFPPGWTTVRAGAWDGGPVTFEGPSSEVPGLAYFRAGTWVQRDGQWYREPDGA